MDRKTFIQHMIISQSTAGNLIDYADEDEYGNGIGPSLNKRAAKRIVKDSFKLYDDIQKVL